MLSTVRMVLRRLRQQFFTMNGRYRNIFEPIITVARAPCGGFSTSGGRTPTNGG
jgi:hypothetical protein